MAKITKIKPVGKRKQEYKPLPKMTEKEALEAIKEALPSKMDNQINKQEDNKNDKLKR